MQDKSPLHALPHASLIVGGTPATRRAWVEATTRRLSVPQWNKISVVSPNPSIGIADIRMLQLAISRVSDNAAPMIGIIEDADRLSVEAQNALLKTLEEPPKHAAIILEASAETVLLPTIVSRCTIVTLPSASEFSNEDKLAWQHTWQSMQSLPRGQRLKSIDAIILGRQEAIRFIDCGIQAVSDALIDPDPNVARLATKTLRRFLESKEQLSSFATPKLVIDNLFLS